MGRFGILMMAALSLLVAACAREPVPEVLIVAGPELACAEQAAVATGLDASVITVTPTASTKTGATVYAVNAGGAGFNCVVEVDGTVSSFTASAMMQ
jgi:streptogramin lyase